MRQDHTSGRTKSGKGLHGNKEIGILKDTAAVCGSEQKDPAEGDMAEKGKKKDRFGWVLLALLAVIALLGAILFFVLRSRLESEGEEPLTEPFTEDVTEPHTEPSTETESEPMTTAAPTTEAPTTAAPTTAAPTTAAPTTAAPTTATPTTAAPTTAAPTTAAPTTAAPTTAAPTTAAPTTAAPTTAAPTTAAPTTAAPTTAAPTTATPTTAAPTTAAPTTAAPTEPETAPILTDFTLPEAVGYMRERFQKAFPGVRLLTNAQTVADLMAASKGSLGLSGAIEKSRMVLVGGISSRNAQMHSYATLRDAAKTMADAFIGEGLPDPEINGYAIGLHDEGGTLYGTILYLAGDLLTESEYANVQASENAKKNEEAVKLAEELNGQMMEAVNVILRLMNEERARVGVPALKLKTEYQAAASVRAREIVAQFSHTRPNGETCFTALTENGFYCSLAGENIGMHAPAVSAEATGETLYNGWLNSPGHYANMIKAEFTDVTMEVYFTVQEGRVYAYGVQLFSAP